jgi:hypothetical protein
MPIPIPTVAPTEGTLPLLVGTFVGICGRLVGTSRGMTMLTADDKARSLKGNTSFESLRTRSCDDYILFCTNSPMSDLGVSVPHNPAKASGDL